VFEVLFRVFGVTCTCRVSGVRVCSWGERYMHCRMHDGCVDCVGMWECSMRATGFLADGLLPWAAPIQIGFVIQNPIDSHHCQCVCVFGEGRLVMCLCASDDANSGE